MPSSAPINPGIEENEPLTTAPHYHNTYSIMLYHPEEFQGSHDLASHRGISATSDEEVKDWRYCPTLLHGHYNHSHRSNYDGEMSDSSAALSYTMNSSSASPRSVAIPPVTTTTSGTRMHGESNDTAKAKGESFPQTLMDILDSSSPAIIEWTKNGQSFVIHDKDRFTSEILPLHFNKCGKFASFARRLHRWGFSSNAAAEFPSRGASCTFSHPNFCRDMPALCLQMTAGGGTGAAVASASASVTIAGKDVGRSTNNSPVVHDNLPLPKGFGDVHAAQAVLSLGRSPHEQPFRFTSTSMCLGMVEDEDDGNENASILGDDVASRLKRMADCCRRYDLHPNQYFATLRNGGASMILLPKVSKSGEEIEPLFDQVCETMGDGIGTGKTKRKGSSDLADTSSPDDGKGRTRAPNPREAKRPKVEIRNESDNFQQNTTVATGAQKGGKRSPPLEVYCKPASEFGKGWIIRGFQRQSGAYEGHVDKYWYSPNLKKRFRSKAEIKRFLPVLKKCKGDEEKAYKMFK